MRRWVRLVVATCSGALWCVPAAGHADDTDPAQAAREIADARQRANDAAQAYFDQQSTIDGLTTEQDALDVKIAAAQRDVDALEAKADEVALNRYTNPGNNVLPLLDAFQSVDDAVQMRALLDVVSSGSADDFDRYRAAKDALDAQRAVLAAKQDEAVTEQRSLDQLRKDALGEVEHLKQVQADRLQDDAVRAALQAEEAQRTRVQMQAAAAASGSTSTTISPTIVGGANADRGGADGEAVDDPTATTTTTVAPGTGSTTTTT